MFPPYINNSPKSTTEAQRAAREYIDFLPSQYEITELSCAKCQSLDRIDLTQGSIPTWRVARWFDDHATCLEELRDKRREK